MRFLSTGELVVDMRHHSRFGLRDSGEHRWHQRPKHGDVIARSMNHDYGERNTAKFC